MPDGNMHPPYSIKRNGGTNMASVTQRIKQIKQPRGGYINPSALIMRQMEDNQTLGPENLHPSVIGTVVDYLTRYMLTQNVHEAFDISILGYQARMYMLGPQILEKDKKLHIDLPYLLSRIDGLDDHSIIAACKSCCYDVWYRNPLYLTTRDQSQAQITMPDQQTISNIRTMVMRSMQFFDEYGPVKSTGFTFEPNGYTITVHSGDGDYLTADTLWDFKVPKSEPTNKHTLQLLMYWIMGQHSGNKIFENIEKLGIFNPRLNKVYTININKVPKEIIKVVETDVIGY